MRSQDPALAPAAKRLHGVVVALLSLQILGSWGHPLAWGAALLTLMAGLKLMESRRGQDLQRAGLAELTALGVLAVITPSLGSTLTQLTTALLVVAALLRQESGGGASPLHVLWRSLKLGVAALPLLVLLFLLMPRLGPLWSVPSATTARTGLSDRLDTGTISQLALDPAPALRISYLRGAPPPPVERYWRVLVLDRFDGRHWEASPLPGLRPQRQRPRGSQPPEQIWVSEPSSLGALPWPGHRAPTDPGLTVLPDGVLMDEAGGSGRRRYGFRSDAAAVSWSRLAPEPVDLAFTNGANPRLEAIAAQWSRTLTPNERVEAARKLMQAQNLRYTLRPAPLPDEAPLDALLFQTRAGFCEHFASAFTALMRAAGVPARVVIGYQGGEWVPEDRWGPGFLEVRQRDAHAWSEVWLAPLGWVRVDPTAWVAPERLESGLADALAGDPAGRARLERLAPWRQSLERTWTRLDLAWARWVLAFDTDSQARLLGRWHPWQGGLLMGGVILLLAPALWWLQRHRPLTTGDRSRRRLERSLEQLRLRSLGPEPGETLQAFTQRIGAQHPELADPLAILSAWYVERRFAAHHLERCGPPPQGIRTAERRLIASLRRLDRTPVERSNPRRR